MESMLDPFYLIATPLVATSLGAIVYAAFLMYKFVTSQLKKQKRSK